MVATMEVPQPVVQQLLGEPALDPDRRYEIVNGQLEEKEMPGARHSVISGHLITELGIYLKANPIGVLSPEANFTIGQNERIPDVAFVAAERIPPDGPPTSSWPIAPDLAVEIISPNDLYEKVIGKVLEYLAAGVREVWLVSPEHENVKRYDTPTHVTILTAQEQLTSALLPSFNCPVSALFH
jgi:Uma2 family endonuclease